MSLERVTRALTTVARRRMLACSLALAMALGGLVAPPSVHAPSAGEDRIPRGWSSTRLPGGRELLIGGEGRRGPVGSATIVDRGVATPLSAGLAHARAWHTATMLPDGRVLIHGGIGANGRVVLQSEIFDPRDQTFTPIPTGLSPRAHHTATLLTDGQVLVVGGISAEGDVLPTAELWNSRTGAVSLVPSQLGAGRARHTATLLGDGRVLIANGMDAQGSAPAEHEIYDPAGRRFEAAQPSTPDEAPSLPATLTASVPGDGAVDVPFDAVIALRFSRPLELETLTSDDLVLWGPAGPQAQRVVPAESGRLVFVTPATPLLPRSVYTLTLHNVIDTSGFLVTPITITFTTAALDEAGTPTAGGSGPGNEPYAVPEADDDEEGVPNERQSRRDPGTDRPEGSEPRPLAPLQAPSGVTALAGQVLRLNGQPLPDVTLRIDGASTRTDATGRFLLTGAEAGVHELVIDGRTANKPGRTYGRFEVNVELKSDQTTVLPYTIWLPKLDTAHAVRIPAYTTSEVVVTTPRIPGLELRIPPHAWIRDAEGRPVTEVTITPIPLDRPPFPLPRGVEVPLYFTIQPGGAYLYGPTGARLIYPNAKQERPGTRVQFWDYDAREKGWHIYGLGTVVEDGSQVVPDPNVVIYKFTGAMVAPPSNGPPEGPAPGNPGGGDGDPVDLGTGLFVLSKTDWVLSDILPIVLTRTYRARDTQSRAFGVGANHPYDMFLVGDSFPYTFQDLVLADGGRIHYSRISPGTGWTDAVYEAASTPGRFQKSKIVWNGNGWDLTLKDGTLYRFPESFGGSRGAESAVLLVRDRHGNMLTLTRDGFRNLTKITSPGGRSLEFTYDGGHRITQAKDHIGRVMTYTYDLAGRLATVTDPNGGVTEYTYDSSSRMVTLKDARGIVFLTNEYDATGKVIKQTQADGTTYQFAYTLGAGGKVTQADVTDPRGSVRRVTFNDAGYVLIDTRALGAAVQQTRTYQRDSANRVTSVTDALGRRTESTYDGMGNLTGVTRLAGTPEAVTTTMTYELVFNQVASVTDPLGHTTTVSYDSRGNPTTITDPRGSQTTLAYNGAGQPVSITDAVGNTTALTYDAGDLVATTDPLGHRRTRFLDGAGRLVSLTAPLGQRTRYHYDALNRLTRVTDALGGLTQFGYDPNGNLLSVTDARTSATGYAYDAMDRLATRTDPLGRGESYVYDQAGNLTTFTDRRSQVTTSTYDALNRLSSRVYVDGSTTSYTWDGGNRLTHVVDSLAGTIARTYDGLDRLTGETTPQGSVTYTYDAAGRRASLTVTGQPPVSYAYDAANRLTAITQGSATVGFAYDNANRRTSLTLPTGNTTEYTYDAASRLTGLTYRQGATVLGTLTYAYDGNGQRRLVGGSWARTGQPDAVPGATYNEANHQLTFGGQALAYDPNGNLLSDGVNSYTWNARNQLAAINGAAVTASFQYDAPGRRTRKTINGTSTDFLYDGLNPMREATGASVATLLTGLGLDEYFTRTDAAGTQTFLTDALGSTVALTDQAGAVQTQYTYEAFGDVTAAGPGGANPFQYTGRENDGTRLHYYRARYYDPRLQRFISEDPIGFFGGDVNLYAYVRNDPVSVGDPLGLWNWGNAFGQAFGGVIGNALGYGFDAGGMAFDASGPWGYYGGAVTGAAGALAGASLGTALFGPGYGTAAGAIAGGMAFGWLGGTLFGMLDGPCGGKLNCNEPMPPKTPPADGPGGMAPPLGGRK